MLALAATGLYALAAWRLYPVAPTGGSVAGLWLGMAGSMLLLFAGFLPLRKWFPVGRLGSAQTWLRAHIWFGLLGSFLILLHAGFRWRGTLEQALMLLLLLLVASGAWGLVAQRLITRQLTLQIPIETFYENLPHECRVLQLEGDVLLARLGDTPLPLTPDPTVATDQRLKSLGVQGRDYQARLAKVYLTGDAPAAPQGIVEVVQESAPAPVQTTPPQALSAAEKIAMMRAKKADAAPSPAASAPTAVVSEATEKTTEPAKALSTAEKLKLMRAKKPEPQADPAKDVVTAPAAVKEVQPAAAGKPLATADKLAMMRARGKPAPAEASTAVAAEVKSSPPAAPPSRRHTADAWKPLQQELQQELRKFFLERVRPFLAWEQDTADHRLATADSATSAFARLSASLPAELHPALSELASLCARRRQLSEQARLYHWLHAWLVFVHIPAAAALLALAMVHIAASLYW